jgi:hypothetical protein
MTEVVKGPAVESDLDTKVFEVDVPPTYSACQRTLDEFD